MNGVAAPAQAAVPVPTTPSWLRSLQYFSVARVAVATVLLAYVPVLRAVDGLGPGFDAALFQRIAVGYLVVCGVCLAWVLRPERPGVTGFAIAQVMVDVVAILALIHASGGRSGAFSVLLLLPIAGAAILSTGHTAVLFASISTLALLGMTGWRLLEGQGAEVDFVQPAIVGTILLATAAVVGRLASGLAAQERLALRRGEDLRTQFAVTQAVIADLPEGVLVLAAGGEPRVINRAARDLLTGAPPHGLNAGLVPMRAALGLSPGGLNPMAALTEAAEFGVPMADGSERRLRARRLSVSAQTSDLVLVLEDLGRLETRAQQLKLASMGRLSASIAHEIRNPLSAIRHANGLLAERLDQPQLERLATIVEDNCLRIDRIIEDVLSISRRGSATPEALPAEAFLVRVIGDLVAQSGADPRRIECHAAPGAPPLWFDAGNLRQVLLNLLGNALRYATHTPGAVTVAWIPGGAERWTLVIADDGPGVSIAARAHLFEPFFTTETRGTGLGLYLARELCTANGATIRYRPPSTTPHLPSAFVIEPTLRSPAP